MLSPRTGETEEVLFSHTITWPFTKGRQQLRKITLIIPSIEVYPKLHSVEPDLRPNFFVVASKVVATPGGGGGGGGREVLSFFLHT